MVDAADHFSAMAKRIAAITPTEFAGAVVIMPSGEDVEPIAFLITDPSPNVLQFLSAVKTRVEIMMAEMQEGANDPYRARR